MDSLGHAMECNHKEGDTVKGTVYYWAESLKNANRNDKRAH